MCLQTTDLKAYTPLHKYIAFFLVFIQDSCAQSYFHLPASYPVFARGHLEQGVLFLQELSGVGHQALQTVFSTVDSKPKWKKKSAKMFCKLHNKTQLITITANHVRADHSQSVTVEKGTKQQILIQCTV